MQSVMMQDGDKTTIEEFCFSDEKLVTQESAAATDMNIRLEANAQGLVIINQAEHVKNIKISVEAGASSKLRVLVMGHHCQNAFHETQWNIIQKKASEVDLFFAYTKGEEIKNDIQVNLAGEHAIFKSSGMCLVPAGLKLEHHLNVSHSAPSTRSEQIYKHVLSGNGKSSFRSRVHVLDSAPESKSYQLNNNLLLSDDARAVSDPELKIDIDNVNCKHGATMGQLSEDELFYCQSRGLDLQTAKSLLIQGFLKSMIVHDIYRAHLSEFDKILDAELSLIQKN